MAYLTPRSSSAEPADGDDQMNKKDDDIAHPGNSINPSKTQGIQPNLVIRIGRPESQRALYHFLACIQERKEEPLRGEPYRR